MDDNEKIAALAWALLPPEKWDEYNLATPGLAKHHRVILGIMMLELQYKTTLDLLEDDNAKN